MSHDFDSSDRLFHLSPDLQIDETIHSSGESGPLVNGWHRQLGSMLALPDRPREQHEHERKNMHPLASDDTDIPD
jgi:hypothetical protein